jgi:hypothetical protein
MGEINIRGFKLKLDFNPQPSKNGRLLIWVGMGKMPNTDKFIGNEKKYHWYYDFRYIDTQELIRFEFDYFDLFVKIVL